MTLAEIIDRALLRAFDYCQSSGAWTGRQYQEVTAPLHEALRLLAQSGENTNAENILDRLENKP